MSSPRNSSSSRLSTSQSSSLPSRVSLSYEQTRTPTPTSSIRRRNNSHLRSSIFDPPVFARMVPALAPLSPLHTWQARQGQDGEVAHREYSQVSFEWQIFGVEWLKNSVEQTPISEWTSEYEVEHPDVLPELLRRGIVIGEGWYKLEMARTIPPSHSSDRSIEIVGASSPPAGETGSTQTLSLYISALNIENALIDYSYTASVFVGIRPPESSVGRRYAETKWTWHRSTEHEFSRDTEYLGVTLPRLDELLADSDIGASNSFTLCVQIGSPSTHRPAFNLPDTVIVPPSVISGLANLLDSTTGDVQFVCLEHTAVPAEGEHTAEGDQSRIPTSTMLSRKRIMYAHSEILKARSGYFKTLLSGGFAEMELAKSSDSQYVTIIVDDASYDTVYWMLKFVYCNELTFSPEEDVRQQMDQLQLDRASICKLLGASHWGAGEWEYRQLPAEGDAGLDGLSELDLREDFETRTVKSVSSTGTSVSKRIDAMSPPLLPKTPGVTADKGRRRDGSVSSTASSTSRVSHTSGISAPKPGSRVSAATSSPATPRSLPQTSLKLPARTTTPSRTAPASAAVGGTTAGPSSAKRSPSTQAGATSPNALGTGRGHYSLRHLPEPDPHPHPCAEPASASALAVYMLAHRYRLTMLEGLAKDHILSRLNFDNCMPMLLATYSYESLHVEVLDYVVDCFGSVQTSPEFKRCIKEVSLGVWGEAGGQVMLGLFGRF